MGRLFAALPLQSLREALASDAMSESDWNTPAEARRSGHRLRQWLIPRSVLGITSILLSCAIGASLSGVTLYSYYEYRLTNTQKRVDSYINGFDERFRTASDTIDAETQNAQASIQKELDPLRQFQAEGGTLASLIQKVGNSVWFLQTQDTKGGPSVASAFVVESNERESVMVTSYTAIKASTASPGPDIFVTKGKDKFKARLDNWVEDKDLAVITVPRGDLPKLNFVPEDQLPRIGERTFVASGLGASGASITQGFVSDVSQGVVQQDAAVGPSFQGGPLLNSDGAVTGVASMNYAPFGFQSQNVTFAVPIRDTCAKLLRCPADQNSVSGPASR